MSVRETRAGPGFQLRDGVGSAPARLMSMPSIRPTRVSRLAMRSPIRSSRASIRLMPVHRNPAITNSAAIMTAASPLPATLPAMSAPPCTTAAPATAPDAAAATTETIIVTALGFPDVLERCGRVLNQRSGEQTTRMAMTIIVNALTFHAVVAGTHEVPSIADLEARPRRTFQLDLLDCWRRILDEIDYWPIFKVASDLVAPMRASAARRVLRALAGAAERLAHIGVTTRHDLTGRMFQNLIADRKFLATFYTLPSSAALLAEMAVGRMNADWRDLAAYPDLMIADLSC